MSSIVFSIHDVDNSIHNYTSSVVKLFTPNCVHESDSYTHNNEYIDDYTSVYETNNVLSWDSCIVKEWDGDANAW